MDRFLSNLDRFWLPRKLILILIPIYATMVFSTWIIRWVWTTQILIWPPLQGKVLLSLVLNFASNLKVVWMWSCLTRAVPADIMRTIQTWKRKLEWTMYCHADGDIEIIVCWILGSLLVATHFLERGWLEVGLGDSSVSV